MLKRNCSNSEEEHPSKKRVNTNHHNQEQIFLVVVTLIDFKETGCNSAGEIYGKFLNNIRKQQEGRRKWLINREKSYAPDCFPIEFFFDAYSIIKHNFTNRVDWENIKFNFKAGEPNAESRRIV